MNETDAIKELTERGIKNIIPDKKSLKDKLSSGKKLNVYLGIDPTATSIHLGNAVQLRKIRGFSELGHNVTLLIGDFTALIGDTSDKESERPVLTYSEIQNNFKSYKSQAEKLIDFDKVNLRFNSEWLKKLTFKDVIKLCRHFSVGNFVSRELIKKRLDEGKRVRLDETLYPVMQGYDSYFLDTDIQLGGADQTFNMQAGRTLQKNIRNKDSFVLVTEYLTGTDGRKMSKSWGNAIWLNDKPKQMYGKVMSIKDELIEEYFILATNLSQKDIKKHLKDFKSDPMSVKKFLAYQIIKELYSVKDAEKAKKHFEKTFQDSDPDYEKTISKKEDLITTLSQVIKSKSQIKRLLEQGAISVNEKRVKDSGYHLEVGDRIKVGKRRFYKIK